MIRNKGPQLKLNQGHLKNMMCIPQQDALLLLNAPLSNLNDSAAWYFCRQPSP